MLALPDQDARGEDPSAADNNLIVIVCRRIEVVSLSSLISCACCPCSIIAGTYPKTGRVLMNRSLSIFLDLLRFVAAVVVVAGHLSLGYFSSGLPNWMPLATGSVGIFFVLSGFVIAFVTQEKEKTPKDYAVARISRLYSVLVPAIILSGVVLWLGLRLDRAYMEQWTLTPINLPFLHNHPVFRFLCQSLLSLTFTNSLHGHQIYPAMNSPVWSLGYEAVYYAVFAVAIFSHGTRRWVLLLASVLLGGSEILRLSPVWLSGVLMFRWSKELEEYRGKDWIGFLSVAGVVIGLLGWPAVSVWVQHPHSHLVSAVFVGNGIALAGPIYYYWGFFTCLAIIAVSTLGARMEPLWLFFEKPIRWLAGRTFSTYLFHYPLLALAYVLFHYDRSSHIQLAAVFLGVLLSCFALSLISEDQKKWWRNLVRWIFASVQGSSAGWDDRWRAERRDQVNP